MKIPERTLLGGGGGGGVGGGGYPAFLKGKGSIQLVCELNTQERNLIIRMLNSRREGQSIEWSECAVVLQEFCRFR